MRQWYRLPELAFGKSIQKSWQFFVTFLDNPLSNRRSSDPGPMPIIRAYHVLDVNLPTYMFEKVIMYYGQVPRSFPVLKFEGFNVDITFEEDELGTIDYFINWCQRCIIDKDGYYRNPGNRKIKALVVEVQDKNGIPVMYYVFHDLYFLNADAVSYSYERNESVKRKITFGVDRMTTYYTKYTGIAATQQLVSQAVGGISSALATI